MLQMIAEQTIDSRKVAEMMQKNHAHLLREIETYKSYLGQSKSGLSSKDVDIEEFFY